MDMKSSPNNFYMYVALRRRKDPENEKLDEMVRRVPDVYKTPSEAIQKLYAEVERFEGTWRFYRSVNKRNGMKAAKELSIEIFKNPHKTASKIESLWKSILLKRHNKAERKWLIDVDTPDESIQKQIEKFLKKVTTIYECRSTKNKGIHYVVAGFNPKSIPDTLRPFIDVKKDDLFFLFSRIIKFN